MKVEQQRGAAAQTQLQAARDAAVEVHDTATLARIVAARCMSNAWARFRQNCSASRMLRAVALMRRPVFEFLIFLSRMNGFRQALSVSRCVQNPAACLRVPYAPKILASLGRKFGSLFDFGGVLETWSVLFLRI